MPYIMTMPKDDTIYGVGESVAELLDDTCRTLENIGMLEAAERLRLSGSAVAPGGSIWLHDGSQMFFFRVLEASSALVAAAASQGGGVDWTMDDAGRAVLLSETEE